MKCSKCGVDNIGDAEFCQECGASLDGERKTVSDKINKAIMNAAPGEGTSELLGIKHEEVEDKLEKRTERDKWPNRLALYLVIWGVLNLFFAWLFGGILLFFAVLIYASKSYKAIYAFGIIYLLFALIQLLVGFYLIPESYILIIFSIINLAMGGYIIYKTRKLEEE